MGGSKKSALAPAGAALTQAGNIVELFMDVVRATFRRPFQFREFIEQAWFIASVTILPTALVAIPFGAVVSLQTGSLIKQLGAESFTGAASVLAVIQQGSPIVTALLIAGAAGSAVTADLGSRTIREEIDAMRVLGIDGALMRTSRRAERAADGCRARARRARCVARGRRHGSSREQRALRRRAPARRAR